MSGSRPAIGVEEFTTPWEACLAPQWTMPPGACEMSLGMPQGGKGEPRDQEKRRNHRGSLYTNRPRTPPKHPNHTQGKAYQI
jgi:hypothetical protein